MPRKIYQSDAERQKAYRMRLRLTQDWDQLRKDLDALSELFDKFEELDRRVSNIEDLAEWRR